MLRTQFKALVLPSLALIIIAAITATAYAVQLSATEPDATSYAEYKSDRWHFSFAVPSDMRVAAYDQAGGGETIQFLDKSGEYKFQVSAWPYAQLDVTLGREGAASNTGDQPDHLEIVDIVRDDTLTVLFEKNGIRYAIVTLPELESWLIENILATWQFI